MSPKKTNILLDKISVVNSRFSENQIISATPIIGNKVTTPG